MEDLERAINRAEEAVAAAPLDHLDRACTLGNLSSYFYSRYNRLGRAEDIEHATKLSEEAVTATPSITRPKYLDYTTWAPIFTTGSNSLGESGTLVKLST